MNEPIKAGDLVMVVKNAACGCASPYLGVPFVVSEIIVQTGSWCIYCQRVWSGQTQDACGVAPGRVIPLWRLRKIDPPTLPEDVEHKEELPA